MAADASRPPRSRPNDARNPRKRRPDAGDRRSSQSRAPRDAGKRDETGLEYVLIHPDGCLAAEVRRWSLPLRWQPIDAVRLLKPGLYLRRQGALHLISRDLVFPQAILFALWDDADTLYALPGRRGDRPETARVGTHAGFLVRSPLEDGPPWLPLMAAIRESAEEVERGLLSPWLDQAAALRFRAVLEPAGGRLQVRSEGEPLEDAGNQALLDLMRWLASHRTDDSPGAEAVRTVLVENGHGVQRLGQLLLVDDVARREAVEELLPGLAPELAPLMQALWNMWNESGSDAALWRGHVQAIAQALLPCMQSGHPAQRNNSLGVLATWLQGLYGIRPDRELSQPAVSLFATARAIRRANMKADLLAHPDADLPSFPLNRTQLDSILRDLEHLPAEESHLERLLRALATAELGAEIPRPGLHHLRPFAMMLPRLHGWPVAFRSLQSRHDYILSTWSFRGREHNRRGDAPPRVDGALFEGSPSVTGIRSLARVLGQNHASSPAVLSWLQGSSHPAHRWLADLHALDGEALADKTRSALSNSLTARRHVLDALGALELLFTRSAREGVEALELPLPTEPGKGELRVTAHFMYWRAFCRSAAPALRDTYLTWLDELLPQLQTLPTKLQTEVLALVRTLLQDQSVATTRVEPWREPLLTLVPTVGQPDGPRGERLQLLGMALAACGMDDMVALLQRAVHTPGDHLQELDRLLDTCARHGWARDLATQPVFRDLHTLISEDSSPAGRAARAAWVRVALRRLRGHTALRSLLDPRRNALLISSDAFSLWFVRHGLDAVEDPIGAWIALLEVALAVQPDEEVDTVIGLIRTETQWPPAEIRKLLQRHGRTDAALAWMLQAEDPDSATIDTALQRVAERCRSGQDLLRLSVLLHARHRHGTPDAAVQEAVDRALLAWTPEPALVSGFQAGLDAVRLLARHRALPIAAELAEQIRQSGLQQDGARAFLQWGGATTLLECWRPLLNRTVSGDAPSREECDTVLREADAAPTLEGFLGRGRGRNKRLQSLLESTPAKAVGFGGILDLAVSALRTGTAPEVCAATLRELALGLQTDPHATKDGVDDVAEEIATPVEAPVPDTTETESPSEETASFPDAGPGEPTGQRASAQPGQAAWLAHACTEVSELIEGATVDDLPWLERAAHLGITAVGARRDVLAPTAELARRLGFKVDDSDQALEARWGAAREIFVDPEDLRRLGALLLELAARHGRRTTLQLDGFGVAIPLAAAHPATGVPAEEVDNTAAATEETSAEESIADKEEAEVGTTHDSGDDADSGEDTTTEDDDENRLRALTRGRKPSFDAWSAVTSSTVVARVALRLLERNPGVELKHHQGWLRLGWGAPPQRKGARMKRGRRR